MPLIEDANQSRYHLQSCAPGAIKINNTVYTRSLILTPDTLILDWGPSTLDEITAAHWQQLLALESEIILLGTGTHFIMPAPSLLAPIYEKNRTVECMDTAAACRTFLALSSESRKVAAALLIHNPPQGKTA